MRSTIPFITIVMPVKNEAGFITGTLMQLLQQDYPPDRFEILLVDGMSEDGTPEIARQISRGYPALHVLKNEKRLPGSGRNIGFRNGKGDVFLVVDGHCHIGNDQLLRNIARCLETSGAGCLGRPQPLDPPGLSEFQKALALARASMLGHREDSLIYSSYEGYASPVSNGAVYTKEVFRKVGYVDEEFDACEDVEFNYRVERAGIPAFTSPSLTIRYYPREDLTGLFRQMNRYGQGRFRFAKKHREAFNVEMLVPPLFVAGFFLLLTAGMLSVFSDLMYGVFVTFYILYSMYILMIVAESARISLKNGSRYFKHLPFIFFTIHWGLGWGLIREAVRSLAKRARPGE